MLDVDKKSNVESRNFLFILRPTHATHVTWHSVGPVVHIHVCAACKRARSSWPYANIWIIQLVKVPPNVCGLIP